jgi:DNA-binding transcriptional ArsR family regulator
VTSLGLPQPVVSQHLAVLARAGIIAARHAGTRRCYHIVDLRARRLLRAADGILTSATKGLS